MFLYSILPLHDAQCFEILCKWIRKGKLKQWNFETSLEAIKTYSMQYPKNKIALCKHFLTFWLILKCHKTIPFHFCAARP